MIPEHEMFNPDEIDALEILRAARIEIGRRLVSSVRAGNTAEVETHRRRMRMAGGATLAIQAMRGRATDAAAAQAAQQPQGGPK